jgi:hypothetical protein
MHCNISGPVAEPHKSYRGIMAGPYHVALDNPWRPGPETLVDGGGAIQAL